MLTDSPTRHERAPFCPRPISTSTPTSDPGTDLDRRSPSSRSPLPSLHRPAPRRHCSVRFQTARRLRRACRPGASVAAAQSEHSERAAPRRGSTLAEAGGPSCASLAAGAAPGRAGSTPGSTYSITLHAPAGLLPEPFLAPSSKESARQVRGAGLKRPSSLRARSPALSLSHERRSHRGTSSLELLRVRLPSSWRRVGSCTDLLPLRAPLLSSACACSSPGRRETRGCWANRTLHCAR